MSTTSYLTYTQGLTRQAQALAHAGALREVIALYAKAVATEPRRFASVATPDQFAHALADILHALTAMTTEDFREVIP